MSHGTHLNESWHACEWVTSFVWILRVSLCALPLELVSIFESISESWHPREWVMAHIWMSHANESRHSCACMFARCLLNWCQNYSCGSVLRHEWDEWVMKESLSHPPKNGVKNGVIALWPNTGVVKFKYYVSQQQNGFNNKIHWYGILLTSIFKFTARL